MAIAIPKTWIAGTPRGYGGTLDWRREVGQCLGQVVNKLSPDQRLAIRLEFRINPDSSRYFGQNRPHGTDLDNLIKETIDGLLPHGGPVDDRMIYSIEAAKVHVARDDESGVFVELHVIDEATPVWNGFETG